MVGFMRNAINFSRDMTTPKLSAAVVVARVLRIPGTLAFPTSAR